MFNGVKIAALTAVRGIGGAIVLGAGFTIGAAVTRASLEAISNAANKIANKRTVKTVETKVAQTADRVASAA